MEPCSSSVTSETKSGADKAAILAWLTIPDAMLKCRNCCCFRLSKKFATHFLKKRTIASSIYSPGIVNIIQIGIVDAKSSLGDGKENLIAASVMRQFKLDVSNATDVQNPGFWRNIFPSTNAITNPVNGSRNAASSSYFSITSNTYILI